MAKPLRQRRDIANAPAEAIGMSLGTTPNSSNFNDSSNDVELYAKEVLGALIKDALPPTPNNFSLYFDRLLENKSESLRKQIKSILQLEENNDDETTIELENALKQGFVSVKNILTVSAGLYKNMTLMSKILVKRKNELTENQETPNVLSVVNSLEADLTKLDDILKKQVDNLKTLYEQTAVIVKNVENETIFDNRYGIYNKRYLLNKVTQEVQLIKEFKHTSTLLMIELSQELIQDKNHEKALGLMRRTIARLLLKTSRRSDIVAHYGNGIFSMLLKHTDVESAIKASQRLVELVHNSNFFMADQQIELSVAIGIAAISTSETTEQTVVDALKAMEQAHNSTTQRYAIHNNE